MRETAPDTGIESDHIPADDQKKVFHQPPGDVSFVNVFPP